MEGSFRSKFVVPNGSEYAPTVSREFFPLFTRDTNSPAQAGVFCEVHLKKGAVIAIDGGTVVSSTVDTPEDRNYGVLIGPSLYLIPDNYDEPDTLCFINHSCQPNIARYGGLVYVAKTDIPAGSELTIDYSPLMADAPEPEWLLHCKCGSTDCRGQLTVDDWKDENLAIKLWPEWLPHVQEKIRKLNRW